MPVDTLDPTWINAPGGVGPSYDSEELRRNQGFALERSATTGSARGGLLAVGDLDISLSGTTVRLGPGGCVVETAKGPYVTGLSVVTNVDTLVAADVTNPRRDRVVIRILDPDNGGIAGRKGQASVIAGTPNASAATGGGYPAEPSGPVLTIGYVDVPKSGAGSPTFTMTAPYTAAIGAPVPVRNVAEREALTKRKGRMAYRLDRNGLDYCNGTTWEEAPTAAHIEFDYNVGSGFPNNAKWGPGTLTLDTGAVSTDLTVASSPAADKITLPKAGLYLIWFGGAFGAGVGGNSWFQIKNANDDVVHASGAAVEFWGSVCAPIRTTAANTTLWLRIKQVSGGTTSAAGKVKITRIG
ncbi:hypothetical protein [Arthrobacter glacialis]|uniref:hypothetical protein n=1 Tax=Arthrobacter glacialis TaxID=1664 RepID=UPI000CD43624|nr:hypothetical protein [Arthrobacter glacialis]POH58261.1 hypothetical protein CVS28_12525 [Arthrobacter glacialis]